MACTEKNSYIRASLLTSCPSLRFTDIFSYSRTTEWMDVHTRMYSSRMRTVRCSGHPGGGFVQEGVSVQRGVCLPRLVSAQGEVSACRGGGGCLPRGGSLPRGYIPPVNIITDRCKKHYLSATNVADSKYHVDIYRMYWSDVMSSVREILHIIIIFVDK